MFSRWAISALLAVVVSSAFVPRVGAGVINDPFDGNSFDANTWQVNLPTTDFQPLGLASNASATVSGGVANLAGRAQLVTKQAFAAPITISGDVRIVNLQNGSTDLSGYADGESITVATRTNATYDYNNFGEAQNSVLFRARYDVPGPFIAGGTYYTIQTWDGTTLTTLAQASGGAGVQFPGHTLRFTITDDGTNVSFHLAVLVNGVPSDTQSLTLTAATTFAGSGHLVSFYDRESPNADLPPRGLTLDNVSITPTPEPGAALLVVFGVLIALALRPDERYRAGRAAGSRVQCSLIAGI